MKYTGKLILEISLFLILILANWLSTILAFYLAFLILDRQQSSNDYGIWYPSQLVAMAKEVAVDLYSNSKPNKKLQSQHKMKTERGTSERAAQKSKALVKQFRIFCTITS